MNLKKRTPKKDSEYGLLVKNLRPLVKELRKLQEQGRALGLSVENRDLLDCPKCRLEEDVLIGGKLIVTRPRSRNQDTGLRFKAVDKSEVRFRCPACRSIFKIKPH